MQKPLRLRDDIPRRRNEIVVESPFGIRGVRHGIQFPAWDGFMCETLDEVRTLDDLRAYIHHILCQKENLLADQFRMSEMQLMRRGRVCGLQFSLQGPRSVRLGAIWASDHNVIYFYDAKGERYRKERVRSRLFIDEEPLAGAA